MPRSGFPMSTRTQTATVVSATVTAAAQPSARNEPCSAREYRATSVLTPACCHTPNDHCTRDTDAITKKVTAGALRRHHSGTMRAAAKRYRAPDGS